MGHFFVVPWLTPSRPTLLGMAVVAILVFGLFAILKATSSGRQAPAKELITGSIPRAAAVRKSLPNDPMVAFLGPASTQLTPQAMQNMVVDRRAVPLPRPRQKRLCPPAIPAVRRAHRRFPDPPRSRAVLKRHSRFLLGGKPDYMSEG